jgi:prophage antirepressor-like protein
MGEEKTHVGMLMPFEFEGASVRVIHKVGEPWFVAKDVAGVLDLDTSSVGRTVDEEDRGLHSVPTPSGIQSMVAINEGGLYCMVFKSRKPEATRFRRWVTSVVLPEIRKTGSYGRDPIEVLNDPTAMRGLLLTYSERVIELEADVAELSPKADALDRIATADGSMCLTDAAKHLQRRPKDLIGFMKEGRWIYRRAGNSHWVGYQDKIQSGYLEHKVTEVSTSDGREKITEQVRVTPKGLAKLAEKMAPGALPLV